MKLELQAVQGLIKKLNQINSENNKDTEASLETSNLHALTDVLNSKCQRVLREVSSRHTKLNSLGEKWSEFQNISNSFHIMIHKHRKRISEILNEELKKKDGIVKRALSELKTIEEYWENRMKSVEDLSLLCEAMQEILPCDFVHSQAQTIIAQVKKHITELNEACTETKPLLDERIKKWNSYHGTWRSLNHFVGEMECSVSMYRLPLQHPTLCSSYLEELKLLADTAERNIHLLKELENDTNALKCDSEVALQLELDVNLEIAQERWNSLFDSLRVLQQQLFNFYSRWQNFISESRKVQEWISDVTCQAIKPVQKDLFGSGTAFQQNLLALKEKEEEILHLEKSENYFITTGLCDPSANHASHSIVLHCKESLENLKLLLQSNSTRAKKSCEAMADCQQHISNTSQFLDDSEKVIFCETDNASSDELEETLGNIKALMYRIPQYEVVLFSLREKLIQCSNLTPHLCNDILQLLLRWKRFRVNLNEKYSTLEGRRLHLQNFVGKCRSILLFLHELQSHLAVSIPSSYENMLKEYCKLQILELKLHIQEKVLHSLISEGIHFYQKMDDETAEKFLEQLNELHDQWMFVCRFLVEQRSVVLHVISLWKHYYKELNELQSWIDRTQKETILVKRISLVTLEEIKRSIQKIEAILDKKAYCDIKHQEIVEASTALFPFLTANAVEIQNGELLEVKRKIDNIWDVLLQKKNELLELQEKRSEIDSKIQEFKEMLEPPKSVVQEGILLSYDELSIQLKEHMFQKERLTGFDNFIDGLEEMISKMDGNFISSEVSEIRNNTMEFRQILVTLHHQLNSRMYIIENKLHEWTKFHVDCSYLLQWIMETERNILERGNDCLEEACQKLEKDYSVLIEEKSQMYNDTITLAETLIVIGGEKGAYVQEDLDELQSAWRKLNLCRMRRLEKLQGLLEEMKQLQQKITDLNKWLEKEERLLFMPIVYEEFAYSEIIRQTEIMEEYEEDIETHYRDLRSVISLCEMLMHDNDAIVNPVEKDALQRSVESFKRRWKEVGTLPAERKLSIEETWNKWKKIMIDLDEVESLICDFENQIKEPKSNAIIHDQEETCEQLKKFESLYQSFQTVLELLESVRKQYDELSDENSLDSAGTLKNRVEGVNHRWSNFTTYLGSIICRLSHTLQIWDDLQALREQLLLWLTELDLHLTEIEFYPERQIILQAHLKAFDEHEEELTAMDQLVLHLEQRSEPCDCIKAEEIAKEVHDYWDNLLKRILEFQQKSVGEENKVMMKDSKPLDAPLPIIVTSVSDVPLGSSVTESTETSQSHIAEPQEEGCSDESILRELENALKETEERLSVTEEALRSQTPIGFETEHVPHNYSRLLAACRSSIDVLKHFSDLIEDENKGLSQALHPCYHHAQGIISRWEVLELKTIEKERRLHHACHQWQQYLNDLTAIEEWLETAQDRQSGWSSPACDMSRLEFMIQSHREFLMEMIKHKPTVLSINMLTQKFVCSSHGQEAEGLQLRVKALNKQWESVCQGATLWQNELQKSLLQCSEFHNTLRELISWLESSEERIHQMGSTEGIFDSDVISIQYNKYLELKQELERCKPKIMTFQQTADGLFTSASVSSPLGAEAANSDSAEIHRQLENASQRLLALMSKCDAEIERLRGLLPCQEDEDSLDGQLTRARRHSMEVRIASEEDLERSQINHCYRYLARVARASLPIQGLMLLLLGIASLVPMSEDDFSCVLSNNFAWSLDPMLQYPDGPPPV